MLLALRTTLPFGLAAGTLYFGIIGLTATLFSVFGVDGFSVFQLVLFIGMGAALGLLVGLVVGIAVGLTVRSDRTELRQRVIGGLAGGLPVLVLTGLEYATGVVGVLDQDPTTVVIIPTAIATIGAAAMAPRIAAGPGDTQGDTRRA